MSRINLPHIATVNQFSSVELRYIATEGLSPWGACVHGDGVGSHGCTFGYGDTPDEALSHAIASAHAHRAAKGMAPAPTDELEFDA